MDKKVAQSRVQLLQFRVYNFLNRPETVWSQSYHILTFLLIFLTLVVAAIPAQTKGFDELGVLKVFEIILIVWFVLEFALKYFATPNLATINLLFIFQVFGLPVVSVVTAVDGGDG